MSKSIAPLLARKYLFGKKSHSAVNTIATVSVFGVAVATAAIICVLSVFNGFKDILAVKLDTLSPDLTVRPVEGKTFHDGDSAALAVAKIEGVEIATPTLTENALIISNSKEMPVTLKGVYPSAWRRITSIDSVLLEGGKPLPDATRDFERPAPAIFSIGAAAKANSYPGQADIMLFAPKRIGRINPANPATGFIVDSLENIAVYQTEQREYDDNTVVTDITTVRDLLQYDSEASAIEIRLKGGADAAGVAEKITKAFGGKVRTSDRMQQQQINFRMISIEKWITFLLLFFILMIASFNIVSTLTMLIIEKRSQMRTLRSLGLSRNSIGSVFAWESLYITALGGISGIILGCLLVILQQEFGLIRLNADSANVIVSAYPVKLIASDILITLVPVTLIGGVCALISYNFARTRK